ncbi:transglycosylase family protein [Brachybacterium subflavum]|uniref:transglycosylase family protein n=1 Tax=Brachybacterium subflavum TaxID=2585206 RepID=UPI001266745D|nr:resuscitation-promoting factor [Brachybacterium subflavum]
MKKTPWIISAAVAGLLVAGGGGTAYAVSNEAGVDVYGEHSTVRTFSPTVGALLEAQGVTVRSTDLVIPSIDSVVTDGIDIQVVHRNPVTVTVDGKAHEVLTTGDTVADALEEVDVDTEKAHVSPDPETSLSAEGTAVEVQTAKSVTFKGQYGHKTFTVYSDTVGEGMEEVLKNIEDTDTAKPGRDEELTDGMTVTVQRVREKETTKKESVDFETTTKKSDELTEGTTKVETEGQKGIKETKVRETIVDGEVTKTKVLDEKVTEQPVDEVVLEGTKKAPEPEDTSSDADDSSSSAATSDDSSSDTGSSSSKSSSSKSSSSKTASAKTSEKKSQGSSSKKSTSSSKSSSSAKAPSVSDGSVWDTIARCESGGNWSINTGNGFKGGLQFTDQTWRAFGGGAYASSADQASRAQQIAVAKKVQAAQGWGAWPGCTSKLGIG